MSLTDDIEYVLKTSFKYPMDGLRPLLIGGGIYLIYTLAFFGLYVTALLGLSPLISLPPFIITIPLIIVTYGYLVKVVREVGQGNEEVPDFQNWTGMFIDGLKLILVLLPWSIITMVVSFAPAVLMPFTGESTRFLLFIITMGVYILVFSVYIYFLPAIITNYCVEDDWHAAFDIGAIKEFSLNWTFVVASLVFHAVYFVATIVIYLSFLTVIGWAFVTFYFWMFTAAYWGYLYRRIMSE
ncbi:MAG: DUF4013 domain-containing protein [Halobacteria archaeon]|nr:DUF4013 domain-containing protein [Halobacteria archaeon]